MSELKDRLKKIRRDLDLTQTEFAEKIGTVQNTITGYESGRRTPSGPVLASICRVFNVNDDWLLNENGPEFLPAPKNEFEALAKQYNLTGRERIAIEKFVQLNPEIRNGMLDYFQSVANALSDSDKKEADLHADLQREIDAQKKAEERFTGSDSTSA